MICKYSEIILIVNKANDTWYPGSVMTILPGYQSYWLSVKNRFPINY